MVPAATVSSTEVLAGLVERVTFHNAENGFCVLRVKARGQRDLITVLGHAAMISAGEFVRASGGWVNDRTHGVHLVAGIGLWRARSDRYRRAARFLTLGQSSCHSKRTKIAVITSRSSGTE